MERAVSTVAALAMGRPLVDADVPWHEVLRLARRERCAPLAWFRGANEIRAAAPREVVDGWRAEAMAAVSLAAFWRGLTTETIAALEARGVAAVVLKGLPLGRRLYGEDAARPCSDLDLYVGSADRMAAHQALLANGWRWQCGFAPREVGYRMQRGSRLAVLEVHSALLDDGLVSHLPFAEPRGRASHADRVAVAAHDDAQLPAFLATHLAKHSTPPLLWLIDLATLWGSLDAASRSAARSAARSARAERYLDWALNRIAVLDAAAAGDIVAIRRLGFGSLRRREFHSALRVASLASTPVDALRVGIAWLVPHDARGASAFAGLIRARTTKAIERVGRYFRRTLRLVAQPRASDTGADAPGARRSLRVSEDEFGELVGALVQRGTRFSIRARGASMLPSIRPGTLVSLAPRDPAASRVGDVVLTDSAGSRYVLHRITRIAENRVQTWGDGNMKPDPELPISAIVAVAEALIMDGKACPIPAAGGARTRRIVRAIGWRITRLIPLPHSTRQRRSGGSAGTSARAR